MQITPFYLLLGLFLAAPVQADIYKYVDENGQVTFTDVYRKGAKRIDLPGAPTPLPTASVRSPRRASYNPSPADFPRIDPTTQKNRDDIRRRVLQDEMDGERRNAEAARKQLQLGERIQPGEKVTDSTYLDRVKRLQAAVSRHEQNISSIQRELANLR
ncbi:MAG: DUF4124 domain-containing protein [Thiobacillus sp.]|nr:DUF4124 domain-containing protein [Thiobacillus sp.]